METMTPFTKRLHITIRFLLTHPKYRLLRKRAYAVVSLERGTRMHKIIYVRATTRRHGLGNGQESVY